MKKITNAVITFVVIVVAAMIVPAQKTMSANVVTAEYQRLKAIAAQLNKIPIEKQDREPHKRFLKKNKKDIVYSEPAGAWYVRTDRFWDLAEKNKKLTIADDIAWTAAQTPIPGECEGDLSCAAYSMRASEGRYLDGFPKGKHAQEALNDLAGWYEGVLEDVGPRSGYTWPEDPTSKADLLKFISELRTIIGKASSPSNAKALGLAKRLADEYK